MLEMHTKGAEYRGRPVVPADVAGPAVGLALRVGAVVYGVLMISMVAFIASSSPPEQLDAAWLAEPQNFALYRLGFVCASLIAPVLVVMLVLLVVARSETMPGVRDLFGLLFLVMYPPLSSVAYTSQYVLLPRLLDSHPVVAASWYFHDSHSIPYAVDLLGYTFFGIAAALLAISFLARPGKWRWLGAVLLTSGLTSILAFAALGAQLETTHLVLSVSSGVLTLLVAAGAFVMGGTLRGEKRGLTGESTRRG